MLDLSAHLKYLESILLKYDLSKVLNKPTMLKYFQKRLKTFILAKLEHQKLKLKNFNQMVKKAANAEAKVVLRPLSNNRKMDQHCPWSN